MPRFVEDGDAPATPNVVSLEPSNTPSNFPSILSLPSVELMTGLPPIEVLPTVAEMTLDSCGSIIITEVMFGVDIEGDWMEIRNNRCESVDMSGWDVGNSNTRGKLEKRRKGCKLNLGPDQYGVIVDISAYGSNAEMAQFIDSLENANICVYESVFPVYGGRPEDWRLIDIDRGSDEVAIRDDSGRVVDRFIIDANECRVKSNFSLEQIKPQEPSVCKNFAQSNEFGGSPGSENSLWDPLPCTCDSIASIPALEKIIITEVMFKPDGANPHEEWVEIYNNGCNTVDLIDWRFGDHSLTEDLYPSPEKDDESILLGPGQYAVLIPALTELTFTNDTFVIKVGVDEIIGSGLNDESDRVFLYDEQGNEIDSFGWTFDSSYPAGKSLERKDAESSESFEIQNIPSPGRENSNFTGVTSCGP
jgi:hypothetical protein